MQHIQVQVCLVAAGVGRADERVAGDREPLDLSDFDVVAGLCRRGVSVADARAADVSAEAEGADPAAYRQTLPDLADAVRDDLSAGLRMRPTVPVGIEVEAVALANPTDRVVLEHEPSRGVGQILDAA